MGGFQYLPTAQLRMRLTGYDLHDFLNFTGYVGNSLALASVVQKSKRWRQGTYPYTIHRLFWLTLYGTVSCCISAYFIYIANSSSMILTMHIILSQSEHTGKNKNLLQCRLRTPAETPRNTSSRRHIVSFTG